MDLFGIGLVFLGSVFITWALLIFFDDSRLP